MGICTSKLAYDDNKIKKYQSQYEALQLRQTDISKLLSVFRKIDVNGGGSIELAELLAHVNLEKTDFAKCVFLLFDRDGSGELDFREFVFSVWNICTLTKHTLDQFLFDLYDDNKKGILSLPDIHRMIQDLYGDKFKTDYRAKAVMAELGGEDQPSSLTQEEFSELIKTHQAILFPAFKMQLVLMQYTLGERAWADLGTRRRTLSCMEHLQVDQFIKLYWKTGLGATPKPWSSFNPKEETNIMDELKIIRKKPSAAAISPNKKRTLTVDINVSTDSTEQNTPAHGEKSKKNYGTPKGSPAMEEGGGSSRDRPRRRSFDNNKSLGAELDRDPLASDSFDLQHTSPSPKQGRSRANSEDVPSSPTNGGSERRSNHKDAPRRNSLLQASLANGNSPMIKTSGESPRNSITSTSSSKGRPESPSSTGAKKGRPESPSTTKSTRRRSLNDGVPSSPKVGGSPKTVSPKRTNARGFEIDDDDTPPQSATRNKGPASPKMLLNMNMEISINMNRDAKIHIDKPDNYNY